MADTNNPTYTLAGTAQFNNNIIANGFGQNFFVPGAAALVSGNNITYTKSVTGSRTGAIFTYVTGLDTTGAVLDTAVTATATGTGTSPSVTSGIPTIVGELFIGCITASDITSTAIVFTQDTGNGWAAPPNAASVTGVGPPAFSLREAGGNQVNSGIGALTFAPTLGSSLPWAAFVFGFKAPATNVTLVGATGTSAIGGLTPTLNPTFSAATSTGTVGGLTPSDSGALAAATGIGTVAGFAPLLLSGLGAGLGLGQIGTLIATGDILLPAANGVGVAANFIPMIVPDVVAATTGALWLPPKRRLTAEERKAIRDVERAWDEAQAKKIADNSAMDRAITKRLDEIMDRHLGIVRAEEAPPPVTVETVIQALRPEIARKVDLAALEGELSDIRGRLQAHAATMVEIERNRIEQGEIEMLILAHL